MASLTGRRALVTGGAGGLGSVAVRTLLELGVEDVLVVGRTLSKLEAFKRRTGERVSIEPMDVTDAGAWERVRERRIDIVIPAAGVSHREPFLESTVEHWQDMVSTNLLGTMLAAKAVLPGMVERRWGRIILISSVAARIGLPGRAVYSATKAALEAWARTLAAELGGSGVLINCVAPGMFPTELTTAWLAANPDTAKAIEAAIPERRFGDPEELAGAYRFLLEGTYVQGSVVRIDGGWGAV